MIDAHPLKTPNDKLSCRAAPGGPSLSYSVNNPIELAPTRSTAASCCAEQIRFANLYRKLLIIVNRQPTGRRGPFFYNSFELRSEHSTSIKK